MKDMLDQSDKSKQCRVKNGFLSYLLALRFSTYTKKELRNIILENAFIQGVFADDIVVIISIHVLKY